MTPKTLKAPNNRELLNELQSIKGMIADQGKVLSKHASEIRELQEHNKQKEIAERAAKQAVDEYKRQEMETAKKSPDSTWLTKELLSVIIKLIAVIAALIGVMKVWGGLGK